MWDDYEWQNRWLENRLSRCETKVDQRNRLRRFEVRTIIIFLLLSCSDDVKIHFRYLSHVFTWERDGVWVKQINKQTNIHSVSSLSQFTQSVHSVSSLSQFTQSVYSVSSLSQFTQSVHPVSSPSRFMYLVYLVSLLN
jgi:hypothetical protein